MKRWLSVSLALAVLVNVAVAQETAPRQMQSVKDKVSYTIGFNIGSSIKDDDMDLDLSFLFEGLRDATQGKPQRLTDEEIREVMMAFQAEMQQRQQAKAQAAGGANAKEGAAFLLANGKRPGVVTLPSGLQYQVIEPGTGPMPTAQDTVKTHYRGTLLDGTEFDSSYSRGKPAEFPVGGVIAGWTEALQKMKVGAKWKLFIPSKLAYGERGAGADIGPNSTLIFDIELLEIVK
ncbi:MAG TPA: FKBP-type peptidyl-prolyl cis-trans isomerase [Thermoguttaceae bacterium]|nr:FKBP-type peptidyl-prolyl cis-trans isomerase [Thermoguttaceae bacterium]